jgi:predicted DNA-binding protein YlxM (UPF0122 family)
MEYTNSQVRSLIDEHIHSERDRRLLSRRLIDGICLEALGEEFQLSRRQVWSIVKKGEATLFKHIAK